MGYNPRTIVFKYEKFETLTQANEILGLKLEHKERILLDYKRKSDEEEIRWKDNNNVGGFIKGLIKDGLKEEAVFAVAHVLKNDFPKTEIPQLIVDIHAYGSLAAARSRLKRFYEGETDLLSETLKDLVINNNQ